MKDFFSIIVLCFFILTCGCSKEPNREEGEFVRHSWEKPIETNKDKVKNELLYKSDDFKVYKVTINDTIVSYFLYEHGTGYLKLN